MYLTPEKLAEDGITAYDLSVNSTRKLAFFCNLSRGVKNFRKKPVG